MLDHAVAGCNGACTSTSLQSAFENLSFDLGGIRFTICPWWDGPISRAEVDMQLEREAARKPARWAWIYHAPPTGARTNWTGKKAIGDEYLHAQPYGAAIDNQGNADCETGQRGYPKKLNSFDPQGRNLAVDPHTPGDQGPTFKGRTHVPAGETFSRNPQTGPQLQANPSNP